VRFPAFTRSLDMEPSDRETVAPPPQDENVVFAAAARQVVTAVQLSPTEVASHYEQIHARIARADIAPPVLPPSNAQSVLPRPPVSEMPGGIFKAQPLWRRTWYALSGAVVAVLIAVAGWRLGNVVPRAPQSVFIYSTANGERANITLPDDGTVALDVASRLEIPTNYAAGNHIVSLRGAALFTVPHHEKAPLTVVAGLTRARVLGTSFLVRDYATDTSVTVAVSAGKVAVGTTVLTAHQSVEIGRAGVPLVRPADPSLFTFATGVLMLPDMPLPRAIGELDRWYDTDIRLGTPALATQRIMGRFAAGSLADLTAILEITFDVRVVRDGRVLTLYPKR